MWRIHLSLVIVFGLEAEANPTDTHTWPQVTRMFQLLSRVRPLQCLVIIGVSLALAACGGGDKASNSSKNEPAGSSQAATAPTKRALSVNNSASSPSAQEALAVQASAPSISETNPKSEKILLTFSVTISNRSEIGFNGVVVTGILPPTSGVPGSGSPGIGFGNIEPHGVKMSMPLTLQVDRSWYYSLTPRFESQSNLWIATGSPALSTAERTANLESTGVLPKLDRSNSVAGPDANGDGVRDDIEAILKSRYKNSEQLAAAMQLARTTQEAVVHGGESPEVALAVAQKDMKALFCASSRLPRSGSESGGALALEIESLTTNTPSRLKSYLKYSKALSGSAIEAPKGRRCED